MLVLAWKLAEARLLADSGEAPVIMLDDVLSELDAHKRQKLLTILSGFQVVITTVDRLEMEVAGMGQIEMADGRVREVVRAS